MGPDYLLKMRTTSFADMIRSRATALREAADVMDRIASTVSEVGTPDYVYAGAAMADSFAWQAHEVQKVTLTLVGRMSLANLTTQAYDLDQLRAKRDLGQHTS